MTTNAPACAGKTQYTSREAAERVAAPLRRGGQDVRAVPCPLCRHWHVGEGRR